MSHWNKAQIEYQQARSHIAELAKDLASQQLGGGSLVPEVYAEASRILHHIGADLADGVIPYRPPGDVREFLVLIRSIDAELTWLETYRPMLAWLWADRADPENDPGTAGHAWALDGAFNGGGWSDVVRNAALLEAALGPYGPR